MLLAYALIGLLVLALMLHRLTSALERSDFLDSLTILHSLACLALTVTILVTTPLPAYFYDGYLLVDQLAIYEVLVSSVIFLLASCYARGYVRALIQDGEIEARELRLFYAVFNGLQIVVVFAFFSNNLALFWILLELTTILSSVLIVTLKAKENIVAALKYLFTASTAMLFSVIGLIILFAMTRQATGTGTLNWDELMRQASHLPPALFTFAFIFIFVGFAAKAGIVPFHTWLPQAHAKAPSVISVILSAVLLNIGIYGILRMYAIAHQNPSLHVVSLTLIAFGVLSIAVASLSMLPRENIKKLVAYSSIEHMGFILIGIGVGTPVALFWVLFHTVAHALVKALLFFSAGILHKQYGSNKFADMKSALRVQPLASWGLIVGSMAIIGVPMFPVFLSKLSILAQVGKFSLPLLFIVLVFFLIVAAAFTMILIRMFSQQADRDLELYQVSASMKASITVLFASILFLGVYFPGGLQQLLNGIVASLGF